MHAKFWEVCSVTTAAYSSTEGKSGCGSSEPEGQSVTSLATMPASRCRTSTVRQRLQRPVAWRVFRSALRAADCCSETKIAQARWNGPGLSGPRCWAGYGPCPVGGVQSFLYARSKRWDRASPSAAGGR